MNWRPVAVILAIVIAVFNAFVIGKKQGHAEEKLSINKAQIHASDSVTKSVTSKVDSAKKSSDILTTYRAKVRAKVTVSHDTITVHDSVVVVSPEIAQLIQADDSTIAALKNTVALQDTLIASLRVGLHLRDTRIALLEKQVTPGKLQRILTAAKWIATGAVVGVAYSHR